MPNYPILKFLIKNTLALTLLILIPDVLYTLYQITMKIAEKGSLGWSGLSLIILLIKCVALEFTIRSLRKDYQHKIIFSLYSPYMNLIFIPVCFFYYYLIGSRLFIDPFYDSLLQMMAVLVLGIQVIIIVKRLGTLNIYKERFDNLENVKNLVDFDGCVEIVIDLKLESLNFRLGEFKVDEEQIYYRNHVYNYERFTQYIREFNIDIKQMNENDFVVAKMYCI
jgi:hypothetical protein